MPQKFAALLMILGGSNFAAAQTADTPEIEQSQAEVEAEIERDIATAEDISNPQFGIELGAAFRKGPGPEIRLNWYRTDDHVYGLKIGQYRAKNISKFDELTLTTIGVQSRFNVGDSFFLEGGLDLTQIKATIDEKETRSTTSTGTYGFEGKVSQSFVQFGFGNQWQSGSWTYGVDWLDLYIPFSGSSFKTSSSGDIVDREQHKRRNKKDFETESLDINYGLSLHAGMTF